MKQCLALFMCISCLVCAAQTDSLKTFTISGEFRPRLEYRDGFRTLPKTSDAATAFVLSRLRLNFDFQQKSKRFYFSVQDVRLWGGSGNNAATGTLSIYEGYIELAVFNKFKLKVGRQAIELDNGRLFSKANWAQAGRVHDGANLTYTSSRFSNTLFMAYNQSSITNFGTNYFFAGNYYTYLALQYAEFSITKNLEVHILNSVEGLEQSINPSIVYARATSGGRITYAKNHLKFTTAGYFQYGQAQNGQFINAYYLQPEVSVKNKKQTFKTRLGVEYLSGGGAFNTSGKLLTFNPLYGAAFKFLGHLNYFTRFPVDVNSAGLANPYLFFEWQLSEKFKLKSESHLFYTANQIANNNGDLVNSFLGYEHDLKLKYNFNADLTVDFGFSFMVASETMEVLKGGNNTYTPVFSFLMLSWKPTFFGSPNRFKKVVFFQKIP